MISLINKFKIPTLLGLGVILIGIAAGVFLVLREQTFLSSAALTESPQSIEETNIEDSSASISWHTASPTPAFVTFGQNDPKEQTVRDDRDTKQLQPHLVHYVTLKNLLPKTNYKYRIISGTTSSEVLDFTTGSPISSQSGFQPVIGSVLDGQQPLDEGIAFLSVSGATIQSALIKSSGNFLIPISQIHIEENAIAKLTIISDKGEASALFKLKAEGTQLPSIKLGQDVDLIEEQSQNLTPPTISTLNRFDLNDDGLINANDHAIVLQNFGKSPKNEQSSTAYKKADLDGNGVVNQKDLDLIAKEINQ